MKFKEFTGDAADLTSRGRAELPETIMIREAMEASATQGGKKMEFVDLTKAELTKTKNRIPNIATRFGYSYRMWETENGIVLSATFKEEKPKAEEKTEEKPKVTAKPAPPKSTTTAKRTTRKTVARA